MRTASDDVTIGQPARPVPSTRPGRLAVAMVVAPFLLILTAGAVSFVDLPYVVMSPGPATNVLGSVDERPVLSVTGAQTYPTGGALEFTTVRVLGGPGVRTNVYRLAEAWLSDDEEVLPEEQVYPPEVTEEQVRQEGAAEMAQSQTVATATALRALGREVTQTVRVGSILEGSPSSDVLEVDDRLVSIGGSAASSGDAVRAAVQRVAPGTSVSVVVERDGARRNLQVPTTESAGRTVLGIGLSLDYDLPVKVALNTGEVGGPSAGLMFSLAIYDVLTPGELTGGAEVAGTGTMSDGGAVGPIGGVRQKMVGARDAGATFFLAPADDCAQVVGHVPDGIQVVRVGTFADALTAVQAIAAGRAGSLPTCR
ncbi:MAG: YlbL family protein [Dermatophilaceae bacterium]